MIIIIIIKLIILTRIKIILGLKKNLSVLKFKNAFQTEMVLLKIDGTCFYRI